MADRRTCFHGRGKAPAPTDFDVTPKKQKPEPGVWNRCFEYSVAAKDGSNERVPQKRFDWVVPLYNFGMVQAHELVASLLQVIPQQGRVTLNGTNSPNPNKVPEVHAMFFTAKGLRILRDKTQEVLRRPIKDTVGYSEIEARLKQTLTADATELNIVVSGDTRHLIEYFMMFDATVVSADEVMFPITDPDFIHDSLAKLADTMGYDLIVTPSLQPLLSEPDDIDKC